MKKWTKAVAAAALVGTLFLAMPGTSLSANLTGGQYTYVLQGEEQTFAFDPIVRKDGLLLPAEVFQNFGIQFDNPLTKNVTLSRDSVSIKLTLGSTVIDVAGRPDTVSTAPLRLSGRLFLPADLLRHFGIEYSQDGTYVFINSYVDSVLTAKTLPDSDFSNMKAMRTISSTLKLDSGIYVTSDFTLLNQDLVNTTNLGLSYGARARLLGLLKTNTLVMVTLTNTNVKSGTLTSNSLFLTDANRHQYDTQNVLDIGDGLITAKLTPSAKRTGVLVFPKLNPDAGAVILYADTNAAWLGTFNSAQ